MKKTILLVLCIALLPAAVRAQEKTLNDISEDMFFLVEAYAACADRESSCTAEDMLAIKAGAVNGLRDFVGLVKSGDRSRIMLTPGQASALSVRARVVREQLAHIAIADESCNAGIHSFLQLLSNLQYLASLLNPILLYIVILYEGPVTFMIELMVLIGSTLWSFLMTIILSPTCLFWWL